ncbi:hypothetical protein [Arthrobacter sp. S41]|uniref:hypothetical protein n=1 Tax=Arthrobacter sp. S41 TaxID=2509721 RepID=UPI00103621E4|nr:hypothetical protein [Arthrobacter sp. S41]TAP26828.1 hypothetical protein EYR88_00205 [Arthrobacter sp. S41]
MDWSTAFDAKSDQLNAIDLITGPRTFTIESISKGNSDQPMNIHLVDLPGRAYRPSLTMRRFMAKVWGRVDNWIGKQLTLYRNPEIRFGKDKVGGIEISHVSGIEKPMTFLLPGARGARFKNYKAEPLTVTAVSAEPTITQEQWGVFEQAANNVGVQAPAQFAAQVLARPLNGPHEITLHEYAVITEKLGENTNV